MKRFMIIASISLGAILFFLWGSYEIAVYQYKSKIDMQYQVYFFWPEFLYPGYLEFWVLQPRWNFNVATYQDGQAWADFKPMYTV